MEKTTTIKKETNIVKEGDDFEDFNTEDSTFILELNRFDIQTLGACSRIVDTTKTYKSIGLSSDHGMARLLNHSISCPEDEGCVEISVHGDGIIYLIHEGDSGLIVDASIDVKEILDKEYERCNKANGRS